MIKYAKNREKIISKQYKNVQLSLENGLITNNV